MLKLLEKFNYIPPILKEGEWGNVEIVKNGNTYTLLVKGEVWLLYREDNHEVAYEVFLFADVEPVHLNRDHDFPAAAKLLSALASFALDHRIGERNNRIQTSRSSGDHKRFSLYGYVGRVSLDCDVGPADDCVNLLLHKSSYNEKSGGT